MTRAQEVKQAGLKSLNQMSELSNVKLRTLADIHKNNPIKFEVLLLGCVAKLNKEEERCLIKS